MKKLFFLLCVFFLCGFDVKKTGQLSEDPKLEEYLDKLKLFSQRVAYGTPTDGSKAENFDAEFQVISDTGTANTEFAITHTLGRVPVGYYVIKASIAGDVYDGSTAWTATTLYLKFNAANANITIVIF